MRSPCYLCVCVSSLKEAGIVKSEETDVAGQRLSKHVPTSANIFESVRRCSELVSYPTVCNSSSHTRPLIELS
jgi:hypothetical protein